LSELLVALIAIATAALILILVSRPNRGEQKMRGEHGPKWPWWHPHRPDSFRSTSLIDARSFARRAKS
jgi:hypothetical protein